MRLVKLGVLIGCFLAVGAVQAQDRILLSQADGQISPSFCQAYGSLSQKIMQFRQEGVSREQNARALSVVLDETFAPEEVEERAFTEHAMVVALRRAYSEPQAAESQWSATARAFGQRQLAQCQGELAERNSY